MILIKEIVCFRYDSPYAQQRRVGSVVKGIGENNSCLTCLIYKMAVREEFRSLDIKIVSLERAIESFSKTFDFTWKTV